MLIVLGELDGQVRAHLVHALAAHERWCRREGLRGMPPALLDLLRVLSDSKRQEATSLGGGVEVLERVAMLLTFDQAAELLTVSPRTVERMVARGELVPVEVGGPRCRRLRAADVVAYIDGLGRS